MFTGIIEERGAVRALRADGDGARLEVDCEVVVADARVGDSIAVDGCCVTVTELMAGGFAADLMGETLRRTALAGRAPGHGVNLERALRADSRLGGHIVQGHVDGVARVRAVRPEGEWTTMSFEVAAELARYVAEKGSVAIDGASLTVTAVGESAFDVGLIPHTLAVTTLGERQPGDRVNVEVDVLAKYVARLLSRGEAPAQEVTR